MIGVTCAAHSLYRITKQLVTPLGLLTKQSKIPKNLLKKALSRVDIFKREIPSVCLPPVL